jgi:hypothetical protein
MKKLLVIALFAFVALMNVMPAFAADKPIQVSLFSPIQIFKPEESIGGLRLTLLYGKNANMTGLDWGLVTYTTGKMTGLQLNFVGITDGDATGLQWNFVGINNGTFTGLKYAELYNSAEHMVGLQIGLINTAGTMQGIQLGLINIIHKGGILPFFPIINGGF